MPRTFNPQIAPTSACGPSQELTTERGAGDADELVARQRLKAVLDNGRCMVCNFCYDRNYRLERYLAGSRQAVRFGVGKLRGPLGRKPLGESDSCVVVRIEEAAGGRGDSGCVGDRAVQCIQFSSRVAVMEHHTVSPNSR